jgi:hypothetical protein
MRKVMGKTASTWLYKYCSFMLVLTLLSADLFVFMESGLFTASEAEAATGDFSVFTETTGTEVIAGVGNNVTWDNSVIASPNIALQGNASDIDLADGGKYLVLYNVWTEEGAVGGDNRRSVASYLTLNSTPLAYGWGGGYIRDQENDFTAYNSGAAIIDVAAGDDLAVVLDRDDANAAGGTAIRPATNGVSVIKIDDDLDYLRIHQSARSADISGNTTFTAVDFDTADEVDTDVFAFSAPGSGVTVSGAITQKLLVTTNVKLNVDGAGGPRQNYELRLTLDGVEVPGTRSTAYIRFDNGDLSSTLQYTGVIQKTSAADQVLAVEVRREGPEFASTDIVGDETALAVVALPETAEVLSVTTDTDQTLTTAPSVFTFGNQISTATSYLTHSTVSASSDIEIDVDGNYLVFATTYTSRTSGTGRDVPRIDWRIDGSTQTYGGHGHFNRGDQATDDAFTSGGSGGAVFPNLTSGQVLDLVQSDETTGTPNADFLAERVAVQVLELSELISQASTDVSVSGAQPTTLLPATANIALGEKFEITEADTARNVTSIILNESGTVAADTGLENIRVFYDLDTSVPYDCSSESYGGGELQFGSTGTFSGPDGTVVFTGSESISPSQSMCAYVVFDTTASASDGQTVNILIDNPSTDVVVTGGGAVSPGFSLGTTQSTIENAEITQTGYHWRNDDGSEAGATSATGGVENTPGLAFDVATPQRLRLGVAVEGTGSEDNSYRLEYAEKVTTCSAIGSWTDTSAGGGAWDMFDSTFLAEGANTTNISLASGGVSDGGDVFKTPNGGVRDVSSQTGNLTLSKNEIATIAEFDSVTVTNAAVTTINLSHTYTDPVVVASARYDRTGTQRTTRISNKTASSFDVLVDNYNGTLGVGTTVVDYYVMEAGDWLLDDGSAGVRVYAATTSTSVVDGRTLLDDPGGSVITYPTAFGATPTVLASVVTVNDLDWVFASVYDGTNVDNKPTATTMQVFLNENFDDNGHTAAEDIDFIVFEEASGMNNSVAFDFTTSGSANVSNTPIAINYGAAFAATPDVILVQALTQIGSDGGYAQIDTNTTPTASAVTLSTDEDGEDSSAAVADRNHGAEEVAVVSFAGAGSFTGVITPESEFVELEYSVQATGAAVEGVAYCFRVTDAGTPLRNYTEYPEATLNADVTVFASDSQIATTVAGDTDVYVGGKFTIQANSADFTLTDLTVKETGTIDAEQFLSNPRIAYDTDTANPRDCVDESYDGDETVLSGSAFSDPNGTTTVSVSQLVQTNRPVCAYVVVDVASAAPDGSTIEFEITSPNTDVVLTGATVGPGSVVDLVGSTTVQAGSLTQAGYHWRNDDGDESGATSATEGVQSTPITNVFQGATQRLRFAVSNDGSASAVTTGLRLEYGTKITTCENVGSWQRVLGSAAFDMASTSQLIEGNDTVDIAPAIGGVSNPNTSILTPNSAQREETDESAGVSISTTEFIELEYAIEPTEASAFAATYCFRVTDAGIPLSVYSQYPELTVQDRQDFVVQRGTEVVSGTSLTLTAGVDYDAPSSNTSAFVRITDTSMTGAGSITLGQARQPDDLFAYIEGGDNLTTSFSIVRPPAATDNTRVQWEIVEYVGIAGADNEFILRDAGEVTYGTASLFATGTPVVGVVDDADVVVFISGQYNPADNVNNHNTGLSISSWDSAGDQPVFERGDADSIAARVSYAVVEFTGASWQVQRAEHTFSVAGAAETESITAVNSLQRTFVHAQKLSGDELYNLDESGHEVWLSSIGAVSFQLESGSTNPALQRSVAWVIENTQIGDGSMGVYRSNGYIAQTTVQPSSYIYEIGATVNTSNASIWTTTRSTGAGSAHPRAQLGARILNETQFELWKSDEGQNQNFRVEIVDWPVAETSIRQTHYRFYVDNDALTPTDPWPAGVSDLGENTSITDIDEPLGEGERVRIRTSLFVNNASLVSESVSFKLQYSRRVTTCSAVSVWEDVGASGGGEIWHGYDATPVDGAELDETLLLSVSDIAGTYEENNPSAVNPNTVDVGEYVEYDWIIENNAAVQKSSYCFRMVESDGSLLDGYNVYPTVRTSGYTPVINKWRWYEDELNLTPSSPAAGENVAPSAVTINEVLKLRVSVTEVEGAPGEDIKFNLEYSEYPDFRDGTLLTATTSCSGNSLWCYAGGAGNDNDVLDTTLLSGVDSCTSGVGVGCGTVNEAEGLSGVYDQPSFSTSEHEFTLKHDGARVNAVYYFRLVDATNGVNLVAESSYPSLSTEGAVLTFAVGGVDAQTTVEGIVTDATTTATAISFGSLPVDTEVETAQRLTVFTNGTEGYRVFMEFDQELTDSYGNTIASVGANNDAPGTWESLCTGGATGCFGYHAGDNTLYDSSLRFALDNTFAGVEAGPVEVMASNVPVTFDVSDIVYKTKVGFLQPAGDYVTTVQYIVIPIF